MTNHYIDIRNADQILIIGSNAAENHPVSFRYVTQAQEQGATLIHVDPRFNRTSAKADIFVQMRSGTDIAFMGGMILHILEDMRKNPQNYNIEYLVQYTNAAYIVNGADVPGEDGLFSGWDPNAGSYDRTSWRYSDMGTPGTEPRLLSPFWSGWAKRNSPFAEEAWEELDDHCVLRLMWEHYKRYDKETVSRITGVSVAQLERVYAEYAKSGAVGKAGTIMYSMGTTQHTYGSQNVRIYAIVQLLLANIGVAGGGVNALRGTSNVQGACDNGLLFHIMPGYIGVPRDVDDDLDAYLTRISPATINPAAGLPTDHSFNWWSFNDNMRRYVVSQLKAWWPEQDPNVSFQYLPKAKAGVDYSHIPIIEEINAGKIKGLWLFGQNPVVGGPSVNFARQAMAKLDWMLFVDIWMNETGEFWKRPGVDPTTINTEVFLLPAAASYEKEGSITNSGRWAQWRYKSVEPPGEPDKRGRSDLRIVTELLAKLKELYEADADAPNRDAILNLDWDFTPPGEEVPNWTYPSADAVAREIAGWALEDYTAVFAGTTRDYKKGESIDTFFHLDDQGRTASGEWLFCGSYTTAEGNKLKKRINVDESGVGLYSDWSWCWPVNRRIIYNRAAVDLDGVPWDKRHPVVAWKDGAWVGDVIDGGGAPINLAPAGAKRVPFIMLPEGVGRLWGYGLADGPVPEMYEPWESPIDNIMSKQQFNPVAYITPEENNPRGTVDKYPYVATTYRCTEHWQTGTMTRSLPWLNELMPEMYVEIGDDLAGELGIAPGDKVKVESARGEIAAVAVVTKRLRRLVIDRKPVHTVGILWQWGYTGRNKGDSGNLLTPHVGDANTTIPESKTFLCNVRRA